MIEGIEEIAEQPERQSEHDHRVQTDEACSDELARSHSIAPIVVRVPDDVAGQTEEKVDGEIRMPHPKIVGVVRPDTQLMEVEHDDGERGGATQSIEDRQMLLHKNLHERGATSMVV